MRWRALILICVMVPVLGTIAAQAQDRAALVADRVSIANDSQLIADGGVEVFYQGMRLRAERIVYDRSNDRLLITGPIVLEQEGGGTIVFADQADLRSDLTEGILTSARLVLDQQLQLSTAELRRIGGRYTQLGRSVASSCKICAGETTPLWEIRASRVVHDAVEQQLYFDNAQFRVGGVPIFYIPRLRMPDPTLDRATGFLSPTAAATSLLGYGVKLPYFIALGPSRDLTLTPYVTTKNARAVELRYREAFLTGEIVINGALAYDDLVAGRRGYVLAQGAFALPRDFMLYFEGEVVSDPAYLLDYGISDIDRLESALVVTRTRRDEFIDASISSFYSIREGDINSNLPSPVTDVTFLRRFSGGPLGGDAQLQFQTHTHFRSSDSMVDTDGDGISDGRDVARASVQLGWWRDWILPSGIEMTIAAEGEASVYKISQDPQFPGTSTLNYATIATEFRWPWSKTGSNGTTHVIEPVVQLVASPRSSDTVPNEDSVLVEFDEGNLFGLNRFPGADAVERGNRANLGITYTRYDPNGGTMAFTLGRVIRDADLGQFSAASGLQGASSDWLGAVQIASSQGLLLTSRTLFDDGFDITKSETRLGFQRNRFGIGASYIWLVPSPEEDRTVPLSEMTFNARYAFATGWTGNLAGRYDLESQSGTLAGLGLVYSNECISVDLSLSRRFTSSTNVQPSTDFNLSVDLVGFGNGARAGPARVCRN